MVERRKVDFEAEAEETKWKATFSGHEECWRMERIAAIEPRMYWVSRVIATWTTASEQRISSGSTAGQSGEL